MFAMALVTLRRGEDVLFWGRSEVVREYVLDENKGNGLISLKVMDRNKLTDYLSQIKEMLPLMSIKEINN